MANCNSCKCFHTITNTVYTADTSLVLTLSNSTNISNRQKFCFCVNRNISSIVTGEPVQVYANVNGTNIPVYTKYGTAYPLYSDLLAKYYRSGRLVKGNYVNDGTTAYVITDIPHCDGVSVTGE